MNLSELLQQINSEPVGRENGDRYQKLFAGLVVREKPRVIVETGVRRGCSTAFILNALEPGAILHSCDSCDPSEPEPVVELEHPQWRFWKMKSVDALPKIYLETGPWDMFLHDSDHGAECQTFEYELAWQLVRNGGIIATDDPVWGNHGAWKTFCDRHQSSSQKIGSCEYIEKVGDAMPPELLHDAVERAVEMGEEVAGLY